ncbi:MAG: Sensor histidine kinase LiaS, partial [Pseudomonadota bacterium]
MQRADHLQTMPQRYQQAWLWVGAVLLVLIATMAWVSWPKALVQGDLLNRATLVSLDASQPGGEQRKVSLPHVFDDEKPKPISGAWRYRFDWPEPVDEAAAAPGDNALRRDLASAKTQALLISRVGARFRVWMDGQLLYNGHWESDGYVDTSVVPHLIVLPDGFDSAKPHRLDIDVQGVLLRKSGLGYVYMGPLAQLQERFDRIYWWQVYLTWMVAASAGVLALLSALVWYASRDKVFGLFAIAAAAWMVRQALTPLVNPMMPFELWFFLHKITFTLYCGFIYLFLWHLYALKHKLAQQMVLGLMTIGPLWIAAIVVTDRYDAYRLWTASFAVVAVIVFGLMLHRARWGFDPRRRMMVVTGVVMLITGLRDFFVVQLEFPGDADLRWMTPGSMLFMLTLGLVLMQRVGNYVAQINQLNADLELRVEQKERELRAVFEALREVEKKQVLVSERARLTRDMHDGLG